ncbi:MAG: hypothetical protein QG602_3541 [Verrucomicrobiota bacterium]|nr:hypothetical protein [Verrucomicrobiota bacterium]
MAGYLCSVCGLHSATVNGCGCLPALEPLPDFSGIEPGELGRVVLLFVMSAPDRVFSCDLAELEQADHYGVSVIGGLGGRAADAVVLRHVTDARGRIARAIDVKRSYAAEETRRARAALQAGETATAGTGGGGGGARVLRPVAPNNRPPGGVGVALGAPAAAPAVSVGWDF